MSSVQAIVDGIDALLLAGEVEFVQYVVDMVRENPGTTEELIAVACAAGSHRGVDINHLLLVVEGRGVATGNAALVNWAKARRTGGVST
jgi:hypothetical protein